MFEIDATGDLLLMVGRDRRAATAIEPAKTFVEAALVEAAKSGDRDAFGQLHSLYASMVHGILLARVPYGEVSDLVQDVFLLAFERLATLHDKRLFGPWLAMIARNRAMDFHRRARETVELSEDLVEAGAAPAREATEALEAIRGLPDAYRETLVLRLIEGMTGPEIAARTGLHPDSVRVNLHRGMKMLRNKLRARR